MAKALVVAFRDRRKFDGRLFSAALSDAMTPSNLPSATPYWHQDDGVMSFISNPGTAVRTAKASVCLGTAIASENDLFLVGTARPDGTFALFRVDERRIEVLSDYAGSRTMWYLMSPELFIASTSQRMILSVVGDFEFNPLCVKWLLTSGTTGPGLSWDKRLRMIEPNSTVTLQRDTWELESVDGGRFDFVPQGVPFEQHREALRSAIETSVCDLKLRGEQWTLALSGGMDSRALLFHLKDKAGINLVTWGTGAALHRRTSDSCIARRLAEVSGLPHRYFTVESGQVPFQTMLERFLRAGEGRIDHFSGYLDGLYLWAQIAGTGRGLLRGYDAFGRKPPVRNEYHARRASSLLLAKDYVGPSIPPEFAVTQADIPEPLRRKATEPLEDWRDRLWLEHRTPNVTAALDEIKTAYVEIANPLLCRLVIDVVRRLPISFRNDKMIFESIVRSMFPSVPFATRVAIEAPDDPLEEEKTIAYLREVLLDRSSDIILPLSFRSAICQQMNSSSTVLSVKRRAAITVKAGFPQPLENLVRRYLCRERINFKRLAARSVIAVQMHRILTADARLQLF
jgi:hypothetical protein